MSDFSGFEKPKANFSPIPHELIAQLPRFKTLAELKIVLYVLRHTWGYQDDYKKITLDEFENGRKTKDGNRIDEGVGMTRPSIISGIKQAIEDGFLYSHSDDNDKARVKKFYSITEQGLKDFTSDVKKLNIGSKETLPRTEKETKDINEENNIALDAPSDSKQKPYYDAIVEVLNIHGGRNVNIEKMLSGKATNNGYKQFNLNLPVSLEEFKLWGIWHKEKYAGVTMVQSPEKIQSSIMAYRAEKSKVVKPSEPVTPSQSVSASQAMSNLLGEL